MACPHERKRLIHRTPGLLKKQSPTKPPNWIRVKGEGEEDWSFESTMEKLIKYVAAGLEDNVLRH